MLDYLIVGQGIAGSLLACELINSGKKVCLVDNEYLHSSSLHAGAVIHAYEKQNWTLNYEKLDLCQNAVRYYSRLERRLQKDFIKIFLMRVFQDIPKSSKYFNYKLIKQLNRVWKLDAQNFLSCLKEFLIANDAFHAGQFDHNSVNDNVWQNFHFKNIIFCEGAEARNNPFFNHLPFTKNRGDVLILKIPDLPQKYIYQFRTRLIPIGDELFWCGSNYQWTYNNLDPDMTWQEEQLQIINDWVKCPITLIDHLVAERPTVAGQLPLMGQHPEYKNMYIFNGFGTHGFSLIPNLIQPFLDFILTEKTTIAGYDTAHFNQLMTKK